MTIPLDDFSEQHFLLYRRGVLPSAINGVLSRLKMDHEKYRFTFENRKKCIALPCIILPCSGAAIAPFVRDDDLK